MSEASQLRRVACGAIVFFASVPTTTCRYPVELYLNMLGVSTAWWTMFAVRAWDAEYAAGRYSGEPPVGFVEDIVAAAKDAGADQGLYIGCGNGRNYIPLTEAGLDLARAGHLGHRDQSARRTAAGEARPAGNR